MTTRHQVEWVDHKKKSTTPAHARYLDGIDVNASGGAAATCKIDLPYPAKGLGLYRIVCLDCGFTIAVTTAGRADDPRSVRIPCKERKAAP